MEKTLIEWIKTIPPEKYEVTLYLMNVEGELLSDFPDFVSIKKIPELAEVLNGTYRKRLEWIFQNNGMMIGINFMLTTLFHKVNHNRGIYYRRLIKYLPDIDDKYDYVVSYTMPDSICVPYVAEKVYGEHKWMWSHIDVNSYKGHELDGMEISFQKFDRIVNVSAAAKRTFELKYPKLTGKSVLINNYLNTHNIIELSLEPCDELDKKVVSFLTVGRITYQKGQDIAVKVAKKLALQGIQFKWYFLGPKSDASYYASVMCSINEENLEDRVIYLGQTDNPYKYMKNCDIYIQPSRFEGYCTTVTEAQILKKPVILTDVAGAREQIKDGVTGIIASISVDDIERKLKKLILDKTFMLSLSENLEKEFSSEDRGFEDVINILKRKAQS